MLGGVEIRATTADDLAACYRVFRAAIAGVYARRNLAPPDPPEHVWLAQQKHVLRHDRARCFVGVDGETIVAFAAAWARGDAWFLASLFVAPDVQGRGAGRALLDCTWGDAATRRTLTDAIQPVSNALYGRRGLIPWTPLLSLAGEARVAGGSALVPSEPTAAAFADLDVEAYGFDRAVDHEYWRESGRCTLWLRNDEPLGYAYSWPHGQVGPLAAADAAAAADVLRAELARTRGPVSVRAPGSSSRLVAAALEAGLRLSPTPGLLLLSDGTPPPRGLAISGYTLF